MTDDLISRQAAIEEIRTYITKPNISDDESEIKGFNDGLELAISVLSVLPSAQPEIIRCEECMHNGTVDTDCPVYWGGKKFCSFGERKEDEHTSE